MELVIATNNKDKLREIKNIIGEKFDKIYSLKDLGIDIDIDETGSTFEENALIKARTICQFTNLPSLGDDSGLSVNALDGAPGVYSARYAGEPCDYNNNINKLLSELEGKKDRTAKFTTVAAIVFPGGKFITAEGAAEGEITLERCGTYGFGYDPVFYSYDLKKTFAQATEEEKNMVSHRGRAIRNLLEKLKEEIR